MGFLQTARDYLTGKHPWGVHPDDHKRPASEVPSRIVAPPARVFIPLSQHVGSPAQPSVLVGQKVQLGQPIAAALGNISAPIHASVGGTVTAIGEVAAPHVSGLPVPAITIETGDDQSWFAGDIPGDPYALAPDEISRRVAAAGVVGLGGATFPSAIKLNLGRRSAIDTLIINGSECEPYLSCDDRLMRDEAAAIVSGIRLMLTATGAPQARVGIEDNKPEAIAAMRDAAEGYGEIRICPVPARYPMGSDRQLIVELTGREVPSDSRAADVGVLVHNVATAHAVHQAVCLGRPLVRRLLTLNGGACVAPGNYQVPVGMLIDDLIAATGGIRENFAYAVMGGPMMGIRLPHLKIPVIKGSSGILLLDRTETRESETQACIRCSSCVKACPMGLLPMEMALNIRAEQFDQAAGLGLSDCIVCGCCAYVCPSRIPLVQYFQHAKGSLAAREREKLRNAATAKLANARQERQARETREKAEAAARRKAEREAAAQKAAAATTSTSEAG